MYSTTLLYMPAISELFQFNSSHYTTMIYLNRRSMDGNCYNLAMTAMPTHSFILCSKFISILNRKFYKLHNTTNRVFNFVDI